MKAACLALALCAVVALAPLAAAQTNNNNNNGGGGATNNNNNNNYGGWPAETRGGP